MDLTEDSVAHTKSISNPSPSITSSFYCRLIFFFKSDVTVKCNEYMIAVAAAAAMA